MNFSGILVGAAVFLSIGICHPLVIKMEYQWGKQSWWVWLVAGLAFSTLSLLVQNDILSIVIGGFAFCCPGASMRCSSRKSACYAAGSRRIRSVTPITRQDARNWALTDKIHPLPRLVGPSRSRFADILKNE